MWLVILMMRLIFTLLFSTLKSLLTDKDKFQELCKAFANDSPTNIKLSKTQLSTMVQLGAFIPLSLH